jgi:DNA polymerase III epsilon subunit-like protein
MHWTGTPIHFIDFEGSPSSGVVEYGVVTLLAGEVVATQTRLCAPSGPIRPEDQAVHLLDAEMTAGAAPFRDDWEIFAGLRGRGPFAAHFAGTENAIIRSAWPYARVSPDFARPGQTSVEWGPWIDTGRLLRQLFRGVISARLEDLVDRYHLRPQLLALAEQYCPADRRFFHAALFDALAGGALLSSFLRQPHFAGVTIPWLLQQSVLDPDRREALQQGQLF